FALISYSSTTSLHTLSLHDALPISQAEFDIPYGNLAQNCGYAMIAQRYGYEYGYDERALAKIAVDQRFNACHYPPAIFHGQPIRSEEHTSELQSRENLVCRLLLEKK